MSARIRSMKSLKSNIIKSKNTKMFAKTVTSNFMKSKKSAKMQTDFAITRSTRFSDNNLTNTIASSIRTISKFRLRKKRDKPKIINIKDFHKEFLLNKNKDNDIILKLYQNNGFNTISSECLSSIKSTKNKMINLKKSFSPSFSSFSNINKSRNIFLNNKYNQKNFDFNSFSNLTLIENLNLGNNNNNRNNNNKKIKNKINMDYFREISEISKINHYTIANKHNNNNNTNNNKEISGLFKNNLIRSINFGPKNFNMFKPNLETKKSQLNLKSIINSKSNVLKTLNNKKAKNKNIKLDIIDNDNSKSINENDDKKVKNFIYIGRNKFSLIDKLAYPSFNSYLFSKQKRTENANEFMYKTKLLALDKYIQKVNLDTYNQQFTINDCDFEKQCLEEKNLEKRKDLFYIYNKTLDNYIRFLIKKYRDIQEENELLIKEKVRIITDIEKIRQKILKDTNTIREGYEIKYFLMCVKNHTLFYEKFSKEDIAEIEKDKLKMKDNYYKPKKGIDKSKKQKVNKEENKANLLPINRVNSYSSIKKNNKKKFLSLNDIDKRKSLKFYENKMSHKFRDIPSLTIMTIDEFFEHFNEVTTKLYNLIKENHDKSVNNTYYKIELSNIIKNTSEETKYSRYLESKIKIYSQNLENLKMKNKKLLKQVNLLKDNSYKNDVKNILILQNIHNIYYNIKKEYNIANIKKEDLIVIGDQLYLKVIEDFFIRILDKVSKDKIKYPNKYEKLKIQIDKNKKYNAFIGFQRLLLQKLQIKIDNVLKKASKVIYKKLHKTNDYKGYYKHYHSIKKKEKKKSEMELFYEFINEGNDNDNDNND